MSQGTTKVWYSDLAIDYGGEKLVVVAW